MQQAGKDEPQAIDLALYSSAVNSSRAVTMSAEPMETKSKVFLQGAREKKKKSSTQLQTCQIRLTKLHSLNLRLPCCGVSCSKQRSSGWTTVEGRASAPRKDRTSASRRRGTDAKTLMVGF